MADKSTDLTVTEGGSDGALVASSDVDVESQNPDLEERSASKFDMAVGDLDLLRQVVLVLSISICVALIVMLFFWVKEPEMRPLGAYETEELIPVLDYLDQQKSITSLMVIPFLLNRANTTRSNLAWFARA